MQQVDKNLRVYATSFKERVQHNFRTACNIILGAYVTPGMCACAISF